MVFDLRKEKGWWEFIYLLALTNSGKDFKSCSVGLGICIANHGRSLSGSIALVQFGGSVSSSASSAHQGPLLSAQRPSPWSNKLLVYSP